MPARIILRQLFKTGIISEPPPAPDPTLAVNAHALNEEILRIFGRAVGVRHVDAGSCNACELEIHAMNGPHYNIEGAGVKFVASPRHADVLLVTGPVSAHLATALRRTFEATPDPKWVVAVGDCAATGGPFGESYACRGRVANVIPVDVVVPGCPPEPKRILAGILTAVRTAPAHRQAPASP
ncbi:NADH-quinone oxidoreductase subunit B family protein [Thiobacter aerophilum]|uniref:NADH-quinone oxidoreductase subunit NuoB n=1 Tax=Thiobacter aerophilum TaxID=3121275 RepID=A0ABV0EDK1_9BURK